MKQFLLLGLAIFLFAPFSSEARWDVDRGSLDDDIVEDVYVPVLFAVGVDDIVPDFGDVRGDGTRTHEGQDIFAPKGTPIVSPTEAVVIRTGDGTSSGKYVYTANPGGETFRYMHLESIAPLKTGDRLKPGDIIGTVGDTGNAPDGVYHLHLEIRDDKNEPLDPSERLTKEFPIKDQVEFLEGVFRDIRNDAEMARFLVKEFPTIFKSAYAKKWTLPREIKNELEDLDIEAELDAEQGLRSVLGAIPKVLQAGIKEGDSSVLVSLLQLYLIYATDGSERDRLAQTGPTGYFGPVTTGAVTAYQKENELPQTGEFDSKTKGEMMRSAIVLNLN